MASSRLPLSSLMNSSSVSPPASDAAAEAKTETAPDGAEVAADAEKARGMVGADVVEAEDGNGGASKASENSVVAFASSVNCAGATVMREDDEL